jgi:PKD repeat protein
VTEIGLGYIFNPTDTPLPGYSFPFYSYWTTDFGKSTNGVVTGPCDYADFSATPTSGSAPLSVSFADQTLIMPRSWSWDFGDGNTSSLQNPVHTYSSDGNFTVALTITVWGISDSIVKTGCINVMTCDAQARVASQPFGTIQLAYDHANNLDSVDARAKDFQENLTFDNNTSVTFRGGFDCNYNSNLNRYTSVNGSLTIGGTGSGTGGVVVEDIILW